MHQHAAVLRAAPAAALLGQCSYWCRRCSFSLLTPAANWSPAGTSPLYVYGAGEAELVGTIRGMLHSCRWLQAAVPGLGPPAAPLHSV